MIGKKIGYKDRELIKEERNAENSGEVVEFIKKIIIIVFLIEGIGAFFLTLEFLKVFNFQKLYIMEYFILYLLFVMQDLHYFQIT